MKVWMWLSSTISSISFAQIATSPSNINPIHYFQVTPNFNQSIFPDFIPKSRIGLQASNLVIGTDLTQASLWLDHQHPLHSHRVQYHQIGSRDYAEHWFESMHWLNINKQWQAGTGILFKQHPYRNHQTGGYFFLGSQFKNQHIQYRLSYLYESFEHLLSWSKWVNFQSFGVLILWEQEHYQAYAFIETPINKDYQAVVSIGTGSKRIQAVLCRNFERFQIQVGTAWLQPLNSMSPFLQLNYDMQTREKNRSAGLCLPSITRTNRRMANRLELPSS